MNLPTAFRIGFICALGPFFSLFASAAESGSSTRMPAVASTENLGVMNMTVKNFIAKVGKPDTIQKDQGEFDTVLSYGAGQMPADFSTTTNLMKAYFVHHKCVVLQTIFAGSMQAAPAYPAVATALPTAVVQKLQSRDFRYQNQNLKIPSINNTTFDYASMGVVTGDVYWYLLAAKVPVAVTDPATKKTALREPTPTEYRVVKQCYGQKTYFLKIMRDVGNLFPS